MEKKKGFIKKHWKSCVCLGAGFMVGWKTRNALSYKMPFEVLDCGFLNSINYLALELPINYPGKIGSFLMDNLKGV